METESTATQNGRYSLGRDQSSVSFNEATEAVKTLIRHVGENADREGLQETPRRLANALYELTSGYGESPEKILHTSFSEPCDEMIVVRDVPFWSLCEHHMLPFNGIATVAYIPSDKVVGLSKIPRLVNCFARRLQIQERLTQQITGAMMEHVNAIGAGCVIKASHTCMQMRGVKSSGEMVTSCLRGVMMEDARCRAEFLGLR